MVVGKVRKYSVVPGEQDISANATTTQWRSPNIIIIIHLEKLPCSLLRCRHLDCPEWVANSIHRPMAVTKHNNDLQKLSYVLCTLFLCPLSTLGLPGMGEADWAMTR